MHNSATYGTGKLDTFVNAIKEICAKYDILVYDAYNLSGFENYMYDNGKDTTHPSQEFHNKHLAPQIAKFIKDNYIK